MFNEWTPWQRGHINDTSLIKGTVTTPARHSVPGMEREREKREIDRERQREREREEEHRE